MAKKYYVGKWDCSYCDTKGISGDVKVCPNCGRPVGENVKYYLDDTSPENEVIPQSEDDVMPEWRCNYCGAYNKYTRKKCSRCGAAKETGTKDYFGIQETRKLDFEGNVEEDDTEVDSDYDYSPRNEYREEPKEVHSIDVPQTYAEYIHPNNNEQSKKNFRNRLSSLNWKIILAVLAGIILVGVLLWLFVPHESSVEILNKEWSRTIEIEHYITVNEDDWELPIGGRLRYTRQEIHHYEDVLDHYETVTEQKSRTVQDGYRTETHTRDLGNGRFEVETRQVPQYKTEYYTETHQKPVYRSEPVYRTRYYYEIERWKPARNINTSGGEDTPYWGEFELASNEREASRSGRYILVYKWKDGSKRINVDQDNWETISDGDTVKAMVNRVGVMKCLF